jgi:RNA polymerase sigma-70 factor (ECF subfamily)
MNEPANTSAMHEWFECWSDDVWRVLRRCGLSTADADDALQQVFLVAARRASSILPGRERAFLMSVAMKVAARLRHQRVFDLAQLTEPLEPEDASQPAPEAALERSRLCSKLDALLDGLDEAEREVVVMTYCAGLSRREVADSLGVPEGTVASRLRRAHAKLGKALASQGADLQVPA